MTRSSSAVTRSQLVAGLLAFSLTIMLTLGLRKLAEDDKVLAIIGPLSSSQVTVSAAAGDRAGGGDGAAGPDAVFVGEAFFVIHEIGIDGRVLIFSFLLSVAAGATPAPEGATLIDKYTLANGLTVVIRENHSSPVVAVQVWVKAGSATEPAARVLVDAVEGGIAALGDDPAFAGVAVRYLGSHRSTLDNADQIRRDVTRTSVVGLPVRLSETPGSIRMAAPEFGQHTEEVLLDVCGYSWEQIEELKNEEVI